VEIDEAGKGRQRLKKYSLFIFVVIAAIILSFIVILSLKNRAILPPTPVISKHTVLEGDSFYACLAAQGLSPETIGRVNKALSPFFSDTFNLRKCYPGDTYEIIRSTAGIFTGLNYYQNLNIYRVKRDEAGGFSAAVEKIELREETAGIQGEIKTSLWEAMTGQGLSAELVMAFADIFAWQVDFLTEPRPSDRYKVVWTRYYRKDGTAIDGKIFSAQYIGRETGVKTAIRYSNECYDLDGNSLRKQFLRAPLSYRRISSHFSLNRFHPILRYYRPHRGIDYAAPAGTPVSSVGDGTVTFCGRQGQYGNLLIIKHNSVYSSYYGHLSRFVKNMRKGRKIRQGEVIGYVGATGLATGPHLDFRITQHGSFVNFLRLKIPPAGGIDREHKEDFSGVKKENLTRLGRIFKDKVVNLQ